MQQMQEFSIHTHTKIGDGYDTVEDMILEAKRSGLKTLGISDHFWAVSYDLPNYVKTIRAAQDKLQFDVLIGLKIDNPSDDRLEMLYKTDYIDEAIYKRISKTCSTIRILLITSIKTAKENNNG